jgi:NADH-quinone oxidoreductase subunit A
METYFLEYFNILVFLAVALLIALIVILLPKLLANNAPSKDKLSPYECGFEPFSNARSQFDIRFYLVAILFIIFDLEIAFLFPFAIGLKKIGLFGFVSMFIFLITLTFGFIYEWKKGALDLD